jgi:hypothetical protein
MMAAVHKVGFVTIVAAGMALTTVVPARAEVDHPLASPVCEAAQPAGAESWAAPPARRMPGEPY